MHDVPPQTLPVPRSHYAQAIAPWWHTGLLVFLLVGTSLLNAVQAHHVGLAARHTQRYMTGMVAEWVLLLLTWWGVRMKGVRMRELLGFGRGSPALAGDVSAAAIFWVMAMIVLAAIGIVLRLLHFSAPQKAITELAPQTGTQMLLWIGLSLSAGFCEEFVFRGYFLRQFASAGARLWLGVLCSSLLFGVSHGYEGAAGMIAITVYGALFCALAHARGSLRPGMMAHAWHDIFTGVVLVLLHRFHSL